MTGLVTRPPTGLAAPLHKALTDAAGFAERSLAPATLRAYADDFKGFAAWCEKCGIPDQACPTTAAILAAYVSHRYEDHDAKVPTLTRIVSGVLHAHTAAGYDAPKGPALKLTMQGIRRRSAERGVRPRRVAPAMAEDLREAVLALSGGELKDLRNRALVLLGFAGCFRRSELVSLEVRDLKLEAGKGYEVLLRRGKTDQEGRGLTKGIPYGEHPDTCPVRALQAWLSAARITSGPLFVGVNRHGRTTGIRLHGADVARVVKIAMAAIGRDATSFSGHSLRAGLITTAANAGKSMKVIMDQSGHRDMRTLLIYMRMAELFRDNAASSIGL